MPGPLAAPGLTVTSFHLNMLKASIQASGLSMAMRFPWAGGPSQGSAWLRSVMSCGSAVYTEINRVVFSAHRFCHRPT